MAEFVLEVKRLLLVSDEEVLEYVTESEHQEGADYWLDFETLSGAVEDFRLYLKTKNEEGV